MVNAALAFQASNSSGTDLLIVAVALAVSIGVAAALLSRQRARVRPEDEDPRQPAPPLLSGRQRKLMDKLEPVPEIPTVMDLVREEIAEAGVDAIPGHDGLAEHVMLKVFKRDQAAVDQCTHDGCRFVVTDGVTPGDAVEHDVKIICDQCGPVSAQPLTADVETDSAETGTDSVD